jgi:DNA (cytosine-5)-methyltransferase 1
MALVEKFLPKVVLLENVPGFITGPTSALPHITKSFARINHACSTDYKVTSRQLNAAHFGVPQRRSRAFVVARRDGEELDWPTGPFTDKPVRAYDALADLVVEKLPHAAGKWADLLPSIPEGRNYLWLSSENGDKGLFGYRTRFWSFLLKLAKDEPSWTLPAQPGPSTGPFHWDNRPLAIEELLRLQSFPATWKITGDYRSQVRQVGNATPPLLAEIIGRALGKQAFGMEYHTPPRLKISRKRRVPPPRKVKPIPAQYEEYEGHHLPHPGTGRGPRPRGLN